MSADSAIERGFVTQFSPFFNCSEYLFMTITTFGKWRAFDSDRGTAGKGLFAGAFIRFAVAPLDGRGQSLAEPPHQASNLIKIGKTVCVQRISFSWISIQIIQQKWVLGGQRSI
jgi:hypothetical protein